MRIWTPTLGGDIRYHADLPACCRREARGDAFECVSCGAVWQIAEAPEAEECGFAAGERDQRGAA